MNKRRVVITGLGAVTPAGVGVPAFWQSLRENRSSIRAMTRMDPDIYGVYVSGEVPDFKPEDFMDRKEARRMDRYCRYAMAASVEAVAHSGIDFEKVDRTRCGVLIGSGIGGMETMETEYDKICKAPQAPRVGPLTVPMMIANMASGNIAIRYGLQGICTCVVTACATGTHAIGDAFHAIAYDRADVMLAGGAEAPITKLSLAGFSQLNTLTLSRDPGRASIPFDKERDGFVIAEGAGVVILEEYEHAVRRGAAILAEVVGYGATGDGYHMTAPHPQGDGSARAMRIAMQEAGLAPEDIGYINAHGTSTQPNDATETMAIKTVLGEHAYRVPISSTKSATGHLLGAAGAIEAIATVQALREGWLPATLNFQVPDPECDLDIIPCAGRASEIRAALSNSLGFGGHNATLAFRRA